MNQEVTKLIKQYDLHADDVYIHETEGYQIIKRRGYKRIQSRLNIVIEFECPHASSDSAVVLAKGHMFVMGSDVGISRQTFGEANPNNNTFHYPVNVAQKRAEGRLILEMAGLYEQGWLAEEEIDFTIKSSKIKKRAAKVGETSNEATAKALGI